jgi:ribosomal protein S4
MTTVELKISANLRKKINLIRKKNNLEIARRKKLKNRKTNLVAKKFKIVKRYKANFLMRNIKKNIYIKKHFKNMLVIKQALRFFYGRLRNSQFRYIHNYIKNMKTRDSRVDKYFDFFERKLPILLLRMHFVPTVIMGLQYILHGYVKVNGKVVTFTNYSVKDGDLIELDVAVFEKYKARIPRRIIPNYLVVSRYYPAGIFLRSPRLFELHLPSRYKSRVLKLFVDNLR